MSADTPEALFERIFEANKTKIYRFAYKLTEDAARAEDITQRCFVRLWENLHLVKEGQDVFPLLFVYVRHLVIDETRKLYREKKVLAQVAKSAERPETDDSGESMLMQKEFRAHLSDIVKKMPEQRRLVYELSRYHGYSHKEIALQMSISTATVKNHLTIALQFIRHELTTLYDTDTQ